MGIAETKSKISELVKQASEEVIRDCAFLTDPEHPDYFWDKFHNYPRFSKIETVGISRYNDHTTSNIIELHLFCENDSILLGNFDTQWKSKKVFFQENDLVYNDIEFNEDGDAPADPEDKLVRLIDLLSAEDLQVFYPIIEFVREFPGYLKITRDGFEYKHNAIDYFEFPM
jgi:hypothetical protein